MILGLIFNLWRMRGGTCASQRVCNNRAGEWLAFVWLAESCMTGGKIVDAIKADATKAPCHLLRAIISVREHRVSNELPREDKFLESRATSSSCSRTQRIVRLRLTFWHLKIFSIFYFYTLATIFSHSCNYHKEVVYSLPLFRSFFLSMYRYIWWKIKIIFLKFTVSFVIVKNTRLFFWLTVLV